jgi:hypothetical protein
MARALSFAWLAAAFGVLGCSAFSNQLFSGPMPAPTAPRVVLAADVLVALDRKQRRGLEAPYWDPSAEDVAACELALWKRAHWSRFHDELPDYAIQFAGVSRRGERRLHMSGWCRERWEDPEWRDHLDRAPRQGMDHGRCHFRAECRVDAAEIASFAFDVRGR